MVFKYNIGNELFFKVTKPTKNCSLNNKALNAKLCCDSLDIGVVEKYCKQIMSLKITF